MKKTSFIADEAMQDWISQRAQQVELSLDRLLPNADTMPVPLHEAMRWACLGSGKRIRACMVYAAASACNGSVDANLQQALNRAAAAVELIHAYSLIHDDLPCMDDDHMRRGKPATHVQFGEAMALLAGDAMQPLAFEWLSEMPIAPALVVQAVKTVASAIGSQGMAGGQAVDLISTGQSLDEQSLAQMHAQKTGSLLTACAQLGAIVVGAGSSQRDALRMYSQAIGLAFQVVDDVLDAIASSEQLGKTAGKDAATQKATYVSLFGVDGASQLASELHEQACSAIVVFGKRGEYLRGLADYIVQRAY
jgi:farnesyl diphosphate synthase